ncbi:dihydrofolate reductase [Actinobacteria bacterium YIM 96077]|uniref:Dihydrofolate reductase n=1 Tax=Phytoactinopolyspora halophila TaxID=1981511 RepID=A0A329R6D2_9ACTN|nr:dihydrofolate reductase family protein [Phytoactinopolyspora halophila]AYY12188.1 dihydrofolate reductase [Actinobacteria bacterium YIM 96077]RAW18578.1 dihydrofolate reductase [Phytoactinopolyspora halophila]
MGKIVSNFFITLDDVVESPDQWHFPYFNDEMEAVVTAGIDENSALLMGRKLYDEWSAYWPSSTDEPIATHFNEIPKYVISSSLTNPEWNNTTVLPGDVDTVRRFKDGFDGNIGISGSATTVRWLLANGLLDELRLLVHPIAVGSGQHLFENTPTHKLTLTHSSTLSTGVLNLTYVPAS